MKLNKNFISHTTGEEYLLVPTGDADFSGIVKGNKTMGDILNYLEKDLSEKEIVIAMNEKYEAPEGVIEKDVKKVLFELRKIGALDE